MRFRFIHAADLHLDTPFEGLLPAPPVVATTLRDASMRALDALVDVALDRQVDFVILAGDVYDGPERGIRAQVALRRGLERLSREGIACFLVHGNHDPIETGWSALPHWPDGVTLFGADEAGSVTVERGGEILATVHGISFAAREVPENLARRFRPPETPGFHIGVLHCSLTGAGPGPPASPCTMTDLEQVGLDYWALGHAHERRVLRHGDPWIVYPGTTQGRKPEPSEQGAHGALVVEVDDGMVRTPEFVALDSVRLVEVEIAVDGFRDLIDVRQALQAAAADTLRDAGGRCLLMRGTLTGTGPAADELRRDSALVELRQQLRDEAGLEEPFVWWDRVRDATRPNLELESMRGRGDFPAEVLAMASELAADPRRLDTFAGRHLTALRVPGLETALGELPDTTDPLRWQEMVELAISLLATVEQ